MKRNLGLIAATAFTAKLLTSCGSLPPPPRLPAPPLPPPPNPAAFNEAAYYAQKFGQGLGLPTPSMYTKAPYTASPPPRQAMPGSGIGRRHNDALLLDNETEKFPGVGVGGGNKARSFFWPHLQNE